MVTEMQVGRIKSFNPLHLILNIISMCIFPVIAKPVLQAILQIEEEDISIKATTNETLGYVGREEGVCAYAVALIEKG